MRIFIFFTIAVLASCTRLYNSAADMQSTAARCTPPPPGRPTATLPPFFINKNILQTNDITMPAHSDYLSMGIPFAPVDKLFTQLNQQLGGKIKSRGEAHITIITPIEFQGALKGKISVEEAMQIAMDMKMQKAKIEAICIGMGNKKEGNKNLETYFIVVKSPELIDIRKKIAEVAGNPVGFIAEDFYPHITVGFTKRDLHLQDCVFKDERACVADLNIQ